MTAVPDSPARRDTGSRRVPAPAARIAAHESAEVTFTVNGTETTVEVSPRMHLGDVLRERLGLTGTHLGCEHGVCGMCTVLLDGEAARACLLFAVQCEGAEIVTVEGLGTPDDQHPLQQAFSAHHALQCGFCTPGMLMSSYDLLANAPEAAAENLPEAMSGVLCRCTGYRGILAAVSDVAESYPDGVPEPRGCAPRMLVGRTSPGAGTAAEEAGTAAPQLTEVRLPTGPPSAVVDVTSQLASPVDRVWGVLTDFDLLARCLPGAQLVESYDEDRHRGRATVALGPVKLSFEGLAQVVERDPDAHRLRFHGQGRDTGGSATAADVVLHASPTADGGTELSAHADVHLSGRVAQFGRALAGDVSRRLFEQFAAGVDEAAETGSVSEVPLGRRLRLAAGAARDAAIGAVRRTAHRLRDRARRGSTG
ncbi:2Fe-2S iron-sulfur cluster-binding protein [Actinomycetospora corticicola]|uniref:Carbon-monoxide dehydrogenase small subunit n=1 Tax=Actinomycetospora corticicola TaxID=663602 RepID=A0A7Y9J6L4_9PSEU|nr:2Fe-2S iron-sulfur cluster-binding protein [Actinomycetospora corticicola]NYD37432.1 carbon-monoxide dehydrogenase small subunit [Actinomycetospora corticicola]